MVDGNKSRDNIENNVSELAIWHSKMYYEVIILKTELLTREHRD